MLAGVASGAKIRLPELVSAAPDGSAGNGPSLFPSVSADGRYVAFRTEASNLVADDPDTTRDIVVRDRRTGFVTLVSRADGANGEKGNRASYNPRISANGRYVVFRSNATNLVPEDTDTLEDVFVRDLQANRTILVSRASGAGGEKGNGGSFNASISADGQRIAFRSEATNLSPEDTDVVPDVYLRDLAANETSLVSRASGAGPKGTGFSEFPIISGDGRSIAFRSESPNLAPEDTDTIEDIFVRDLETGETLLVSRAAGTGAKGNARSTFVSISANGNEIAFDSQSSNIHPEDTLPDADVFLRDMTTGEVELISRASGPAGAKGVPGSSEPSISANGRYVAFQSAARNLDPDDVDGTLDVYLRDRETFSTEALSPALENPYNRSFEAQMAPEGGLVAYQADAGVAGSGASVPPSDVWASVAPPKLGKCMRKRVTMVATTDGVTKGTRGDDVIVAGDGAEQIKGGRGNDRICAGGGEDVVKGGKGKDKIKGGGGADLLKGNADPDKLLGNGRKDVLHGGGDDDRLNGGGARDRCDGAGGDDKLKGCEVDEEKKGKGKGKGKDRT